MATTTGFKVQCPSCEASVTIKNASLIGKKVDCPKCKYRFVVESPDDAEAGGRASRAGQAGGTAVARKAPGKSRGDGDADEAPQKGKSKTTLIVGIVLVVVTVLVLGAAGAYFGGLFDDDKTTGGGGSSGGGGGSGTPKQNAGAPSSSGSPSTDPGSTPTGTDTPRGPAVGSGAVRDETNLLPNDAEWVADVDVEKVRNTPAGSAMFDPSKQMVALFKEHLAIPVSDIVRVVGSGGSGGAWSFTVVKTKSSINEEALRTAAELREPIGNIMKRDYYLAKDNPVFDMVGNFFATKLKDIGFIIEPPAGPREITVCLLDSKTLVVADKAVMEKFLNADAQPDYRSKLTNGPAGVAPTPGMPGGIIPSVPGGIIPSVPGGGGAGGSPGGSSQSDIHRPFQGPPMPIRPSVPGGPGGPGGPSGPGMPSMPGAGGPAGGGGGPKVFTHIPSFRTVHPNLKAMLNYQGDEDKPKEERPLFNFAAKVETNRLLEAIIGGGIEFGGGKFRPSLPPGVKGREAIPKAPYIGLALYAFTAEKFDLRASMDCDDEEQAKDIENVLRIFLPIIALVVQEEVGIPVQAGSNPNQGGGFPGFPGYPGGYPGAPSGPGFPGGPGGGPRMPGPGGPGVPGGPSSAPGGGNSGEHNNPFQGPPAPIRPGGPGGPGGPPGYPGGPPPGYPGSPSMPGMPGGMGEQQQKRSHVDIVRSDKIVTFVVNLEWKEEWHNKVANQVRDYFDGVAGQGMLLASKHPWQKLPAAVRRLQASGTFPRAALSRPSAAARMGLPFAPEQRVSWMVELLPGLGYDRLYREIDKNSAWNSPNNLRHGRSWIPEFLDPSQESRSWRAELTSIVGRDLGATHFVGLSGIGDDAAELPDKPEYAKRLGIFGYERQTAVNAITDGLDKTIFMIQVQPNIARPWIRGGGATVQSVSQTDSFKPFRVMQEDGEFGAYAIMCDGTVRFIKTTIPDELFKAMVTYKAGDSTAGIDEFAPKRELTTRLRTGKFEPAAPPPPPSYMPKDWQPLGLRVFGASYSVGMPPGRIDSVTDRNEEKHFTAQWTAKKLTLGAYARSRPGLPASDPDGSIAAGEIERFLSVHSLSQDGSISDAPTLNGSKGKEFRAKPDRDPGAPAQLFRLWVVNGARFALSVGGPSIKTEDAEEYFKTATAVAGGSFEAPRFGKGVHMHNPALRILIWFPGEPNGVRKDNVFLYYPEEAPGGAYFTLALISAKLDPAVDIEKGYRSLEKAVKEGQFGEKPLNIKKKMMGERPGVACDIIKGDTPFSTWIIYNNEESAVVLSVRKDIGISAEDEKRFFESLQFGIDKPPQKEGAPGTPGVPSVPGGGPGGPPPGAPGVPPGPPK